MLHLCKTKEQQKTGNIDFNEHLQDLIGINRLLSIVYYIHDHFSFRLYAASLHNPKIDHIFNHSGRVLLRGASYRKLRREDIGVSFHFKSVGRGMQ